MAKDPFIQRLDTTLPCQSECVVFTHVSFDASQFQQGLFTEYGIEAPASLNSAVIKRKAEYLAGRYVARDTLKKLTQNVYQIPTAADRAPVWPTGTIGSITHTNTEAMAVVAYKKDHQLLGVDLEGWFDPSLAHELAYQIIDEQESTLIHDSGLTLHHGLTLIFSAKESLYKALYPKVRTFFGFEDARVNWIDPDSGVFELSLVRELNEEFQQGWSIKGRYFVTEETVLTLICDAYVSQIT